MKTLKDLKSLQENWQWRLCSLANCFPYTQKCLVCSSRSCPKLPRLKCRGSYNFIRTRDNIWQPVHSDHNLNNMRKVVMDTGHLTSRDTEQQWSIPISHIPWVPVERETRSRWRDYPPCSRCGASVSLGNALWRLHCWVLHYKCHGTRRTPEKGEPSEYAYGWQVEATSSGGRKI
jgi:hypothetical protein